MQWNDLVGFHRTAPSRSHVLATMVEKSGSSYRQPGARMIVRDDGERCGGVSAGCLEDDIARAARAVFDEKAPRLLMIDTRPHYGCPGQIKVLLELLTPERAAALFSKAGNSIEARRAFAVVTDYRNLGDSIACTRIDEHPDSRLTTRSGVLVEHVGLLPRVVIVGEGADAVSVAKAAALAGWDLHVLSPESVQFARGSIARKFSPDERTAVILLTHNLGLDVACLADVLPLPYSYVGVIGSLRRRNELVQGLEETENPAVLASIDRLFCPAGLDLGARESGEIALSILAEIQSQWTGRDAGSLRERAGPIHHSEQPA